MLIGQAGSTGGKTRQEVKVGQGEQEDSGKKEALHCSSAQITEEARCELPR